MTSVWHTDLDSRSTELHVYAQMESANSLRKQGQLEEWELIIIGERARRDQGCTNLRNCI